MEIVTQLLNNQLVQAAIVGLLGLVWHKAAGDKKTNILDGLAGILKQEAAAILLDPAQFDRARERLDLAAWSGLERLGVKRSKALEPFVNSAIEQALGELAHKLVPQQLDAMSKQAQQVLDTLNKPMPQPDPNDHIDVEIVK